MDVSSRSSESSSISSSEPFGQRTASWALSLDNLLSDDEGVKAFSTFLQKERSGENIAFWLDCKKLRSLTDPKEIRMKVRNMYSHYFALTAGQAINVDSGARIAADNDVLSPGGEAFHEAEQQIYQLMKNDSYPRFLKSDLFSQLVKDEISVMMKSKKDNRIFSRYKTSLKHKLTSSTSKRDKNISCTPVNTPLKPINGNSINNNDNCSKNYNSSNNQLHTHFTTPRCKSTIKDEIFPTPASSVHETSNQQVTRTSVVSKFLSDWNLLEEHEYEQFFSDIVSSSQRPPLPTVVCNQSTSHPCLIDSIGSVNRTIGDKSPSLGDLRPSMLRPPPPPPPVPRRTDGRAPCPPPVPSKCSLLV